LDFFRVRHSILLIPFLVYFVKHLVIEKAVKIFGRNTGKNIIVNRNCYTDAIALAGTETAGK